MYHTNIKYNTDGNEENKGSTKGGLITSSDFFHATFGNINIALFSAYPDDKFYALDVKRDTYYVEISSKIDTENFNLKIIK